MSARSLTLMLFKMDLSVIAIIGVIMLVGIVKKNAIMMIDFALDAQRNHGETPERAIHQACLLRFRPIMMTTHGGDHGKPADRARPRRGSRACASRWASPSSAGS